MEVLSSLILFVVGFFVLIKGAQFLVRGAVSIAHIFKVSTWFIGVVLVSAGTSIPELSINLAAAFDQTSIGIATVLGSNIFNVFFVLGFMALFSPIVMHESWVKKDLFWFGIITLIGSWFIVSPVIGDIAFNGLSRGEGVVFLAIILVWLIKMLYRWDESHENLDFELVTLFTGIVMIVGGVIGVFAGGRWVVDGAVTIAEILGVSSTVIGFSVVALGTSLPELVVSYSALRKGSMGIAVGNVVGSSIFNLLGVLGATAVIQPIVVLESISFEIAFMVLSVLLWFIFMFTGKKLTLSRFEGTIFLVLYAFYVYALFT